MGARAACKKRAAKKEANAEEAANEESEADKRRQLHLIWRYGLSTGMWVLQVTVNDSLGYDLIAREQVYVRREAVSIISPWLAATGESHNACFMFHHGR